MKNNFCVLLIHGFASSRQEVVTVKEYFKQRNINAYDFVLDGHEKGYRGLLKTKNETWIQNTRSEMKKLTNDYEHVIVIGFSMGGLLATYLNDYNPLAYVFINCPIYFWDIKRIFLNIKSDFAYHSKQYLKYSFDKPPQALIQFMDLLKKTKDRFEIITAPTLIIQALDDDTVRFKSADFIYNKIKSASKKRCFFETGGHQILNSTSANLVCEEIYKFIENLNEVTDN